MALVLMLAMAFVLTLAMALVMTLAVVHELMREIYRC